MMLDVNGSMCQPCTKIQAVQSSATDLINIVVWADQSQYYSRVALAPFAAAVNVGTTLAPLVRGTVTANTQNGSGSNAPQAFTTTSVLNDTTQQPTKQWIKYTKAGGSGTWVISDRCVTERIGAQAYTDAAPAGTSTYVDDGRRLQHQLLQGYGSLEFRSDPSNQLQLREWQVAGPGD